MTLLALILKSKGSIAGPIKREGKELKSTSKIQHVD